MAISEVGEVTVTFLATVEPKWTVGVPTKLLPVTVTVLPPESGPKLEVTPETTGSQVIVPLSGVVPLMVL